MRIFHPKLILFASFALFAVNSPLPAKDTDPAPPTPALDPAVLKKIDAAVASAVAEKKIPGAVLWLEHRGAVHHKAYGNRALLPEPLPAAPDTIYDAASLTKVVVTTTAILQLAESGFLDLDDPVAAHLPAFTGHGKDAITIRHLLSHTSGLRPGIPKTHEWANRDAALAFIHADTPQADPGASLRYSDLNFILLDEIAHAVSGKPLNEFAVENIFSPLKMKDSGFRPPTSQHPRIAPTTKETPVGTVHDPTAQKLKNVAGHAGLFTTAPDLARFCRMLLNGGTLDGATILQPETVAMMSRRHTPPEIPSKRGLGWDIDSFSSSPRGEIFTDGFGHTGWTGTSIWISPATNSFVILLANRNHPTEKGSTKELRHIIGTLAARALPLSPRSPNVLNGIDVLSARQFASLDGLSVGLITNHTGLARDGTSTIDLLHAAPSVQLAALFSPEHGIRGTADDSVSDDSDPATGLPIHSLYQSENRKPTPAQLAGLDALVFDIQDIGCRFYTYISTMGLAMEAAHEAGIRFVVLDRINPIGGSTVEGPVLLGEESFTGFHPIPVRHGMTVGELARMFRAERDLEALDLAVVPLRGWNRDWLFDEIVRPAGGQSGSNDTLANLKWVNPSPNMRSLTAALLYPGVGLLEFMNLSVGRGTKTPFEIIGAPGFDADTLARDLTALDLPGVAFKPAHFTPDASIFKNEKCHGVAIQLTDRKKFQSVRTGIAIARTLHQLYADEINYPRFAKLLVHPPTFDAVKNHRELDAIEASWQPALDHFRKRREKFLLY